jgi:hypothetical protein
MRARQIVGVLGVVLVGCGGSTAGERSDTSHRDGGTSTGSSSSSTSNGSSSLNVVLANGSCYCDPSNPVQSCCPADTNAAACIISASNYDTSCTVDSDCVGSVGSQPVLFGNWCVSQCSCGGGLINKDSADRYAQDVAATPLGSGAVSAVECGCLPSFGPCCSQGKCTAGAACTVSIDAGIADADLVDGPSGSVDYTVLCVGDAGPVDAGSPSDNPAVPGASRWCNGPEVCTPFNGGWACCVQQGVGAFCVNP